MANRALAPEEVLARAFRRKGNPQPCRAPKGILIIRPLVSGLDDEKIRKKSDIR